MYSSFQLIAWGRQKSCYLLTALRPTNRRFLHCTLAHQYINGTKSNVFAGRKAGHGSTALHLAPRVPEIVTAQVPAQGAAPACGSVHTGAVDNKADSGIMESSALEETFDIVESNHQTSTATETSKPHHPATHPVFSTPCDSTFLGNLFQCLTTLKWINQVPSKSTHVAKTSRSW